MTIETFIKELQEELEFEEELSVDTDLKELDDWDSMAAMVLIAFVGDNFNITLSANDIEQMTTINSLIDKIGKENFD